MTKVNFAAAREKAAEAGLLGGGGVFNKVLKNGNRFRLDLRFLRTSGYWKMARSGRSPK